MYIYYTQHKDAAGVVSLTELKLTSVKDRWQILWRHPLEDALFKLCNPLLKMPPIASRSYDEQSKIWTYFGSWGADVLSKIIATTAPLGGVSCIEVPDLAAMAMQYVFDPAKLTKPMDAEEFFYNPLGAAAGKAALTRDEIVSKLAALGVSDKKTYRAAAMQFHPDRNNGDGSKMSELNMLWQLYNAS